MPDCVGDHIILLADVHPLIVEDCRLHAQTTYDHGEYEVVAVTAAECTLLPLVERLQPHFVLLDLLHASGLHTIRRLTSANPSCGIAVMIGARNQDSVAAVFSSGASSILHRTDVPAELFDAVRAVSAGRRFLSSTILSKAVGSESEVKQPRREGLSSVDELVLRLTSRGYPSSRIADTLGLSVGTVRLSIAFLKQMYRVRTKRELKAYTTETLCES
ncbi:MAG: response regulator transcription factor [Nitrospira sp.]|nr:response regulator transcription factor [Nitrospira sp.]MDH4303426.1 response regulator transcription factor [Nitrospira sp.]MDH5192103.1 response regulator transcription factor [Nitrospira sp.]